MHKPPPPSLLATLITIHAFSATPEGCIALSDVPNPHGLLRGYRRGPTQARELIVLGLVGVCPHPTLQDHHGVPVQAVRVTERGRAVLGVDGGEYLTDGKIPLDGKDAER